MAVVKYYTKLVAPRLGLCSNWLASLTPGLNIPVWIRRGSFRFPVSEVSKWIRGNLSKCPNTVYGKPFSSLHVMFIFGDC